jgi:hypothetical protein
MAEITLGSKFGRDLFLTVRLLRLQSVLEIGSFDGDGSTQVFIRAMQPLARKRLVCLELRDDRFGNLRRNTVSHNWVEPVHASTVSWDAFTNRDFDRDVWPHYQSGDLALHDRVKGWWEDDVSIIQQSKKPGYLESNSDYFDGVFIDGGEFSGYDEFRLLRGRTHCFLLDDAFKVFKTRKVYQELAADPAWQLIRQNKNDRNGTAIFCRCDKMPSAARRLARSPVARWAYQTMRWQDALHSRMAR